MWRRRDLGAKSIYYMLHDKECLFCSKIFKASTSEEKRGSSKFCSRKCFASFRKEEIRRRKIEHPNKMCAWCGIKFFRGKRSHSKSGLSFCSSKCKDRASKIKDGLKEIHPSHYGSGVPHYRTIAFDIYQKVCMRCGYDKHGAAIIVHHKDRNRSNNLIENLEVLCCNCHAIEHWS